MTLANIAANAINAVNTDQKANKTSTIVGCPLALKYPKPIAIPHRIMDATKLNNDSLYIPYIKILTRFDFLNDRHSFFSISKKTCCVGGVVLTPLVGGVKYGLIVPNAFR